MKASAILLSKSHFIILYLAKQTSYLMTGKLNTRATKTRTTTTTPTTCANEPSNNDEPGGASCAQLLAPPRAT